MGFSGCAIDEKDDGRKKAVIALVGKYENYGQGRKAAEEAGINHIYTENTADFAGFESIVAVNPVA